MVTGRPTVEDWTRRVDVGILLAIAGLHVGWGEGSCWPMGDLEALNRTVLGREPVPGSTTTGFGQGRPECYAVAGALAAAAALVAGRPRTLPGLRRAGVGGVVAVLSVRGLAGVSGRTRLLVPTATGETFTRLDRRWYGPLCLLLAALSSRSLARSQATPGVSGSAAAG